jgi:hypothetical protein
VHPTLGAFAVRLTLKSKLGALGVHHSSKVIIHVWWKHEFILIWVGFKRLERGQDVDAVQLPDGSDDSPAATTATTATTATFTTSSTAAAAAAAATTTTASSPHVCLLTASLRLKCTTTSGYQQHSK